MASRARRRARGSVVALVVASTAALAACSSGHARPESSAPAVPSGSSGSTASSAAATPSSEPTIPGHASDAPSLPSSSSASAAAASSLPLDLPVGSAQQVITVTAPSTGSTTATVQAWNRAAGGWTSTGAAVTGYVGSAGLSTTPSEQSTATPIGSFTLTQAFGRLANPGTALPYLQTTPSDWWISQAGSLYNTHQRCASGCAFNLGSPNEHLYYETPYYNYAVVIDYNTRNAPGGVRPGAGSAFFLHVTVGQPTQGCVSIPQGRLVQLLQWLNPAAHPRILIGIG